MHKKNTPPKRFKSPLETEGATRVQLGSATVRQLPKDKKRCDWSLHKGVHCKIHKAERTSGLNYTNCSRPQGEKHSQPASPLMQREFLPLQSACLVAALRNTVINSTSPPGDRHLPPPPLYRAGPQGVAWRRWSFVICLGTPLRSTRPKLLGAKGDDFLEDLRQCFAPVSHTLNSPTQRPVGK